MKEDSKNVWAANLNNGLLMACLGIVYTMVMYFCGLMFNNVQSYVFYALQLAAYYFFLKMFRDKYRDGYASYGQVMGAGVVISVYYAIIMAFFIYLLYKFIDPSLIDQSLAKSEQLLIDRGMPQSTIDTSLEMSRSMLKPGVLAFSSAFSYILYGVIFSLVAGIFVRKDKNPLFENGEIDI